MSVMRPVNRLYSPFHHCAAQSSVLGSTTTALGVTTAIPEATAMERISGKLRALHLEYSPQKKIELLLKTCRIIYDSMAVSSPGHNTVGPKGITDHRFENET